MIGAGLTNPPMELGETLDGKDQDGNLTNEEKLGQIYVFPAGRFSEGPRGSKGRYTGRPLVCVLLRNTSGLTLLGKRLGQLDRTAGYAMTKNVDGYSTTLANQGVVLIDPYLPSGGVADDDIFWGIVRGPALVLLPLTDSGHQDISVNDPLVAHTGTTTGATTSGRVTKFTMVNATAGNSDVGLQAFRHAYACLGRAMSARTSQETTAGADLLVDLAVRWF